MTDFSPLRPIPFPMRKIPMARIYAVAMDAAREAIPPMPLSGGVRHVWKRTTEQGLRTVAATYARTPRFAEEKWPPDGSIIMHCHRCGHVVAIVGRTAEEIEAEDPACEECGAHPISGSHRRRGRVIGRRSRGSPKRRKTPTGRWGRPMGAGVRGGTDARAGGRGAVYPPAISIRFWWLSSASSAAGRAAERSCPPRRAGCRRRTRSFRP